MSADRLSTVFSFWKNKNVHTTWLTETEGDMSELDIEDMTGRNAVKLLHKDIRRFQESPETRKQVYQKRMRNYWANIKAQRWKKRSPK